MEEFKESCLQSRIVRCNGFDEEGQIIAVYVTKNRDVFLSNLRPTGESVSILYAGSPDGVPEQLLDKLLITGDSSDNDLRPFRWYKRVEHFADTNDQGSINAVRKQSFKAHLDEIDSPEKVWIYELDVP